MLKVDNREDKKIFRLLDRQEIEYEKCSLPIGDYLDENVGAIFERKTVQDFVGSIRNGKIQKQLLQQQQYPHSFLIIVGNYSDLFKNPKYRPVGWTNEHHWGSVASCALRYGCQVFNVENDSQFLRLVIKLCEKCGDGKTVSLQDTELLRVSMTSEDYKLKLLCCLPNIGFKRARKLLEKHVMLDALLSGLLQFLKDSNIYKG